MTRWALTGLLVFSTLAQAEEPPSAPWIHRLQPFGAAQGETVEVEIIGERLDQMESVDFDTTAIAWLETLSLGAESIRGRVRVAADAALGAHIVGLEAANGHSTSRLFYVDALPSSVEREPNDGLSSAQEIELRPQVVHGALPEAPDRDYYRFAARAGERWVFDVRSIEYGGFLESELALLDASGQPVDFNDDRDEYLETPTLEHTFPSAGVYYLKVDQYRGPQGVDCNKNCGYMLRISQTAMIEALHPLGARRGGKVRVSIRGRGLSAIDAAWITPARNAEHYRLTYPHTIPVLAAPAVDLRVDGKILKASDSEVSAEFAIPADAAPGLWRLWTSSPAGPADGISFEIADAPELSEAEATAKPLAPAAVSVNGSLDQPDEEDVYTVELQAGQPFHAAILAVQMGLPAIDAVLELFAPDGSLAAEHDDLMSGQGTVIGNPDPSLYYTAPSDGTYKLHLRDRIGRGGPSFVYRLKVAPESPGYTLITDAENPQVPLGGEAGLGVLLIRDPGFEQAVDVWVEDPPPGLTFSKGEFRADQFFGPSADGDNVIIPAVMLRVQAGEGLATGERPLKIMGKAEDGRIVQAYATLWIGPPRKRNDVRRPLPAVSISVVAR